MKHLLLSLATTPERALRLLSYCVERSDEIALHVDACGTDVTRFISHLSRLAIPAIRLTAAETNADLDTLEQWLQSSSPTQAR